MIKITNVNFKYNECDCGISDVNLNIKEGEFVVLCGASGCGKTTVTRLINGLIPHFYKGDLDGDVLVCQENIKDVSLSKLSSKVGSMFQNPKSQFFNTDTTGELAFGCENMKLSKAEISDRINDVTQKLSLNDLVDRNIFELSGGEKQQIALGSICAPNPYVYVLDEPTSNMDTFAINRLKNMLIELKNQGKTIVISEHRLYFLMDLADKFVYMQDGKIVKEYSNKEFANLSNDELFTLGLRHTKLDNIEYDIQNGTSSQEALNIEKMICKRKNKVVLEIEKLSLPKNSVVSVIGENGSGKSTFAEVVTGLIKSKGVIEIDGKSLNHKQRVKKSYMVMQDVNHQLFCETVEKEIVLGSGGDDISDLIETMMIDKITKRHPLSLSGGQKQRVAICSAVHASREIMIYDEPTSGLDYKGMKNFCEIVKQNQNQHLVTIVITHDLELIMGCTTHILHVSNGKIKEFYELSNQNLSKLQDFFILRY